MFAADGRSPPAPDQGHSYRRAALFTRNARGAVYRRPFHGIGRDEQRLVDFCFALKSALSAAVARSAAKGHQRQSALQQSQVARMRRVNVEGLINCRAHCHEGHAGTALQQDSPRVFDRRDRHRAAWQATIRALGSMRHLRNSSAGNRPIRCPAGPRAGGDQARTPIKTTCRKLRFVSASRCWL